MDKISIEEARPKRLAGPSLRPNRRADGEASRARILDAAGKLFAEHSFSSVSTRRIAKAAGANLSAIGYHFGGKDELYGAVLKLLVADTEPLIGPAIAQLNAGVAAADGDRYKLAEVMTVFLKGLLTSILGTERMRWQMALMLREFHNPSSWFPMLLDERIHPLHNAVAGLIGAASGRPAEAPETRLLTASLIGQCMALGAARRVVWARLDWDEYTPERVDFVIATIVPAVLAMFDLPNLEESVE
jgi:AcrR family transcriptional regulator